MASSYPGGLDNFSTSHADNVDEIIHASTINDNADAINKIEAELGTNPKGSSADVKTRLANVQPLSGATAATRYVGGTTSGAPVSGTFAVGDYVVAQNGHIFVCTGAGTPGTWVDAGSSGNLVSSVFTRTGAVTAQTGDYTAAQVTNAADKSSGSQQNFTGEVKSPDFVAGGLTGATAASRYVGATASGAPASGTFSKGDYVVTQDGHFYICTTAGSPGTWVQASGGSSSPLTTKGDVWGFSTVDARIPIGSNGQVLTADSTQALGLKWATGFDTLNTVGTSGASQTVNYSTANVWDITLTAACTLTLSGATNGVPATLNLILRQDATGSRTVTWPASVTWLDSAAPVLQTAPSSVDVVSLTSVDGGTTWYGFAASDLSLNWKTAIPGTCTYGSSTTFTCSGDQTSTFVKGKKLRILQTTFKYFVITGSSYNGTTTTTVTITGGSDYSLANASLDQVLISGLDSPDGWPGWFNFNAALTGTSAVTPVTRFSVVGNTVNLELAFQTGTSNATTKTFTLPITPANISNIQWSFPFIVKDNGTTQTTPGLALINPNNASVSLYKTYGLGAWTASGGWFAIGSCSYEF